MFQAARINQATRVAEPGSLGPWRNYVGTDSGQSDTLNLDGGNGVRFLLIFNRTITEDIAVTRVSIFCRG